MTDLTLLFNILLQKLLPNLLYDSSYMLFISFLFIPFTILFLFIFRFSAGVIFNGCQNIRRQVHFSNQKSKCGAKWAVIFLFNRPRFNIGQFGSLKNVVSHFTLDTVHCEKFFNSVLVTG